MGVLQAIAERQEDRKEDAKRQLAVDDQRTSLLARALGQGKTSTSARFPGVAEQFAIAVAYLGQLQTHDDIEDDEDAMHVVSCIADVVHGSEQGPAQRMAACVWALAERDLPVARAVIRLRALVQGTGVGNGAGNGGSTT